MVEQIEIMQERGCVNVCRRALQARQGHYRVYKVIGQRVYQRRWMMKVYDYIKMICVQ